MTAGWVAINANVKPGRRVRVALSDAPEFEAVVTDYQEDDVYGVSFLVLPTGRQAMWVSEHRLTAVQVAS